jgi:hypothetical protein
VATAGLDVLAGAEVGDASDFTLALDVSAVAATVGV